MILRLQHYWLIIKTSLWFLPMLMSLASVLS
jgi:hypothetical protein